jgi:hypothetical protein
MHNLRKIGVASSIILAISSLNITLFENPVLGSSQYVCYTGKFYVDVSTNSGGQLVYKSFTGNYNYNNPPHGKPDLILYNGKIISRKKHTSHGTYNTIETSTVTNWTNPGGFIYQIHHYEQTEGADPGAQSGTLTVFQNGRKIYEGACQFDD